MSYHTSGKTITTFFCELSHKWEETITTFFCELSHKWEKTITTFFCELSHKWEKYFLVVFKVGLKLIIISYLTILTKVHWFPFYSANLYYFVSSGNLTDLFS